METVFIWFLSSLFSARFFNQGKICSFMTSAVISISSWVIWSSLIWILSQLISPMFFQRLSWKSSFFQTSSRIIQGKLTLSLENGDMRALKIFAKSFLCLSSSKCSVISLKIVMSLFNISFSPFLITICSTTDYWNVIIISVKFVRSKSILSSFFIFLQQSMVNTEF